jgi:hypothetical protein
MGASSAVSTTTDRPSATVTASRVNPGSTPVTPHLRALGAQGERQRIGEPCHLGGIRCEQIDVLRWSIHQIMGEHRATSGQGNLPGRQQREGNPVSSAISKTAWSPPRAAQMGAASMAADSSSARSTRDTVLSVEDSGRGEKLCTGDGVDR